MLWQSIEKWLFSNMSVWVMGYRCRVDEQLLDESSVSVELITRESGNGDVVGRCLMDVDA